MTQSSWLRLSGPIQLNAAIEVIENLLSDLAENGSLLDGDRNNSVPPERRVRRRCVDTTQLTAMSMIFEVV